MKLFSFGKAKPQAATSPPQSVSCKHPVSHQVTLREDPSDSKKVTGIKCTQCGERLPLPEIASR